MGSMNINKAGATDASRQHRSGNQAWDTGIERRKCGLLRTKVALHAWHWDGESVLELRRQIVLLGEFPDMLRRYASSVPRGLRLEAQFRTPDPAMRDRYLMNVVAVDRQGYALIQTTWFGDSDREHPPGYVALPVPAAKDLVTKYRRGWFRAHGTEYPEGPLCRRRKADAASGARA